MRNGLRDVPNGADDVQLRHAPRGDHDRRHRDQEANRESVDEIRVRPCEDESGAAEGRGAEDLREPHKMTPATSRPVNVPTTEDSRAYSRPSDTKLWTRFVRRIPRARATPISP